MKNKKHKIEIPEGYEVTETIENMYRDEFDKDITTHITVNLKPTKKELPKTWEEYLRQSDKCYPSINHIRIPLQYNEAFKALGQLIELRDRYNDGWEPDWNSSIQIKHIINVCNTQLQLTKAELTSSVLAFKTRALRDRFYQYFRPLIETAKPLL